MSIYKLVVRTSN